MGISSIHAQKFYAEVAKTKMLWTIKDRGGYPAPMNSEGRRSMHFWSSQSRALKIITQVKAYAGFEIVAIEWQVFLEKWVPGLIRDELLIGVNWSGKLATGYEIAPTQLVQHIDQLNIDQLNRLSKLPNQD